MNDPSSFAERRAALLKSRGVQGKPPGTPKQEWDPALVPDTTSEHETSDPDMDRVIESIDIIEAYRMWCSKMTPKVSNRTEGVMISCPNLDHEDKKPSAWLNTVKRVWNCGGCDEGGDIYDLAAIHYGMTDYKTNGQVFHKLREQMAEDFGYTVKKLPGNQQIITGPEPVASTPEPVEEPPSNVVPILHTVPDEPEEDTDRFFYPKLHWREFIPEDTFLHEYLSATCNDDSPEEYHIWHGLLCVGHAVGRRVTLEDRLPVYGNLLVCLLGGTGFGKTSSARWMNYILDEVLPYNPSFNPPSGVKQIVPSGSGEHLIQSFCFEAKDPVSGVSLGPQPINGIVEFDEMARIMRTVDRQNSILGPIIMSMGDAKKRVAAGSLSGGERIAIEPFCSIATSTQPRAIRELFTSADSQTGFLNRWIFVAGPPKQRESVGGRHAAYQVDLTTAAERLRHVRGWGSAEKACYLTDKAFAVWNDYFHSVIEPIKKTDDTDLLKRLDLILKKIMLLLAINERTVEIGPEIVESTKKFTNYLLQCYKLLDKNIGVTLGKEISDEVLRHITRHTKTYGRGPSARDIGNYCKRKNWTPKQIKDALDALVTMEYVEPEKPAPGPGRKTIRYKAVGE